MCRKRNARILKSCAPTRTPLPTSWNRGATVVRSGTKCRRDASTSATCRSWCVRTSKSPSVLAAFRGQWMRTAGAHAGDHFLPFRGRGILPALAQHGTPLRRQTLKAVEVVAHDLLFIGRQRTPLLEALARKGALLGRQRKPALAAALERRLALGRKTLPLAGVRMQQLLLRGGQTGAAHSLSRGRRGTP